jgi:hypothetical protein
MSPSSTLAEELAEREGFELGQGVSGISKLLNLIAAGVPSDPPTSPYLPPDLPPEQARANELVMCTQMRAKSIAQRGIV